MKRKLNARIEYAKFLQGTVKEMAKELQNSQSGEMRKTAEDLAEFMKRASSYLFFPSISKIVFILFTYLYLALLSHFNRLEKVYGFLMMKF